MINETGSANAGATLVLDVDTSSADRKLTAIDTKLKALGTGGSQAQNDKVKRLERDVTELKAALEASQLAMTAYEAKLRGVGSSAQAAASATRAAVSASAGAASVENNRNKLLQERAAAAKAAADRELELSRVVAAGAAAGVSAVENNRNKLLQERAAAAKAAADRELELSRVVAAGAAAGAASVEQNRIKLLQERAAAAKVAADRERELAQVMAASAAAGAASVEQNRLKLLQDRAAAVKQVAVAEGLLYRGAALNTPSLSLLSQRVKEAGTVARDATLHTHAFNLAQQTTHATLRGVTGVLGGLWLSYAKLVPVLLAAAAATKSVKDSITGGLDTTFQAQFIATVDTKGFSQGETLRGVRETILKDLTNVARDSVFTVEENADALHKLSLAGVDASRGIGLLKTASDAAVFAQKGLGETTAMVLDTLYNFGLASQDPGIMAENFERAANIMSYTAISVNASFDDIAKAFTNITGVAGSFNIQIEEASALLANLAQTGIRGQKAGTYVRNFLDDLMGTPISLRAERAMRRAGIGRYDPSAETEYGASKYIDDAVSKIKQLSFIEQQDFLRAATNQRSRRVWRQELISSYNEETTLLRRVSELAEKAEGSLANMAKGLKDSGKYSILMAQSAYNASVIGAYQSTEADLGFQEIGKQLQATFNSTEFNSLMKSIVASTLEVLKALTSLFDYVVKNQDAIKTALSAAFDVAVIIGFGAAFSKTISFVASAIDKATKALVAFKVAQAAAAAGSMMTGVAAAGSIVGAGILGIHYLESKKLDHSAKSLDDVNAEMAELERRVKNLSASNDYTGYAEVEIADLERRLASLKVAAKEKAVEATDGAVAQRVQSITQRLENESAEILEVQAKVERVLNAGLYKGDDALSLRLSTTKRTLDALTGMEREYGDEIAKVRANIQKLRETGASDSLIDGEIKLLQGLTASAYKTSESIDNLQSQMATAIEKSVFAGISEDAKKAGLDSTAAIKEITEGYDKLFRDAVVGEEALALVRRRASEEGAAQLLERAAAWEAQVASASSPELASALAEQALKARATAEEMKSLASSIDLVNQSKAYLAGSGPITQDMLINLSTSEIQAMADGLKNVADQANLTKEALRAISLTNIMDQAGKAWAEGNDTRAAALSRLAEQQQAAWVAMDRKAAANKGPRGSQTADDRIARDAAATARRVAQTELKQMQQSSDMTEKYLELYHTQRLLSEGQYNEALYKLGEARAEQAAIAARKEVETLQQQLTNPKLTSVGRKALENDLKEAQARLDTEQSDAAYRVDELRINRDITKAKAVNQHIDALTVLNEQQRLNLEYELQNYALTKEADPVRLAGLQAQLDVTKEYSSLVAQLNKDIANAAGDTEYQDKLKAQLEVVTQSMTAASEAARSQAEGIAFDQLSPMAGLLAAVKEINFEAKDLASTFKEGLTGALDIASDGFANLATTGKMNVRSMVTDMLTYLSKLLAHKAFSMLAGWAVNALLPSASAGQYSLSSGSNLSGMGGGQGLKFNALGNAFSSTGVQAFAKGGAFGNGEVLTRPTLFQFASGGAFRAGVAGEAGPEAALPLKRMSNGKLGVYVEGAGGGVAVTQHFHINVQGGSDEAGGRKQGEAISKELRQSVRAAVLEVITNEKRYGGALS